MGGKACGPPRRSSAAAGTARFDDDHNDKGQAGMGEMLMLRRREF